MTARDRSLTALCLAALLLSVSPFAGAQALPILIEGDLSDWGSLAPIHTDPSGDDGGSAVDFGRLWAANDDDHLFLRFEVGGEIELQESNDIALHIDADNSALTGLFVDGIGAEIRWRFGARAGSSYRANGTVASSLSWIDIEQIQGPTTTSTEFELSIIRDGIPGDSPFSLGSTVAILLRNEPSGVLDRLPDVGTVVTHTFDATPVPPPTPIPLARQSPDHVRVMTHNTLSDGLFNHTAEFTRILQAIEPDVICFQEIYSHTATEVRDEVTSILPPGPWYAVDNADCHIVSRWPILTTRNLDGNIGALIDIAGTLSDADLYVVSAHTPCCSSETGRQAEIDNIMAWVRDLQTPGGVETLADDTPIVITGDMNLVGYAQQLTTLLTGDIVDEGTFGPDHPPDWDGTALGDPVPRHTHTRSAYTWRSDGSSYAPGRLDFIVFTDSAVTLGNHFTLWTPDMAPADLSAAGLQANDTSTAADHLPVVADFLLPVATPAELTIFTAEDSLRRTP
ncbi:endonuclease/exonuclease/phosphatase family protein [Candidatus Sumerlaeota bacterium]|nr:endonuclease/exonuclease/phosphatase family protein [Candidatus Sumerlaeota bacterium]